MKREYINRLFRYVMNTSKIHNIDESHSLNHSMDVYYYANKIYKNEYKNILHNLVNHTTNNHTNINQINISSYKKIIDTSAILHDMCDKKYMNEEDGLNKIKEYIKNDFTTEEIKIIEEIIGKMSYSKVKKDGYPDLKNYQLAYHITREADLLSGYDVERSIIYGMYVKSQSYQESVLETIDLFNTRILKYDEDNLFYTNTSLNIAKRKKEEAIKRLDLIKNFHIVSYRLD